MAENPLISAVQAHGQTGFARMIGTSQQNVANWISKESPRLPAEFVLEAEAKTGTPRHVWRPDIYPPEEYANLIATCGTCELRADDPQCRTCIRSDCGLRHQEAA